MKGSPPFRRTTLLPACARRTSSALIASCGRAVIGRLLADVDALSCSRRQIEQRRRHQIVIHHHICACHQAGAAQGQQFRVTRSGPDQIDMARQRAGTKDSEIRQGHAKPSVYALC
ncbi:hypothetical protein MASR2M16_02410 [Thauera terpenica]